MNDIKYFIKLELDQNIKDRDYFIAFKIWNCGSKGVSLFPDNIPSFWHPTTSVHRGGLAAIMRPFPKNSAVSFKSPLSHVCGIPTIYHQRMPELKPERKARCIQREIENAFEVADECIEQLQSLLKQTNCDQGQLDYILVPYKNGEPAFGGGTAQGANALPESCREKISTQLSIVQARCEQVVTIKVSEMSRFKLGVNGLEACAPFTAEQLWQANSLAIQELIYYLDWFTDEGEAVSHDDILNTVLQDLRTRFCRALATLPSSKQYAAYLEQLKQIFNLVMPKLYPGDERAHWDCLIKPHILMRQRHAQRQQLLFAQQRLWVADKDHKRAAEAQEVEDKKGSQDEEQGLHAQGHKRMRADAGVL